MLWAQQRTGDPGHIMISDEGLRHEPLEEPVVALQRPFQFMEVPVVETAPDGLPQFVLSHRVHPGVIDETAVVAMDHFGDEPGFGVGLPHPRQHLLPEGGRHGVGGVESPPVGPAVEPVPHHLDRVVGHSRIAVIQGDQVAVAFEGAEPARAPPEPVGGGGITVLDCPPVLGEIDADVIENPVQQDPQTSAVSLCHKPFEVPVVPESGVESEMVGGVVTVCPGGEHRTQGDSRDAEPNRVVEPFGQPT